MAVEWRAACCQCVIDTSLGCCCWDDAHPLFLILTPLCTTYFLPLWQHTLLAPGCSPLLPAFLKSFPSDTSSVCLMDPSTLNTPRCSYNKMCSTTQQCTYKHHGHMNTHTDHLRPLGVSSLHCTTVKLIGLVGQINWFMWWKLVFFSVYSLSYYQRFPTETVCLCIQILKQILMLYNPIASLTVAVVKGIVGHFRICTHIHHIMRKSIPPHISGHYSWSEAAISLA